MVYNDIMTIEQAAEYLKIDVNTLYDMSKRRLVPCVDFTKLGVKMKEGDEFRYSRQLLLEEMVNASITQHSDED